MTVPFSIHRVDRSQAEAQEPLGSKPKFWFREGERRLLFKAEFRGYGEDWAEVVASHLCGLLGVPHIDYELASCVENETVTWPGVVCENMIRPPDWLVLGNQLLLVLDPQYPDKQQFKVRQHTVDAVANAIGVILPPLPKWSTNLPATVESALDVFVGYVLVDAWIANQDRHHENWGAIVSKEPPSKVGRQLSLAPTFDHAAGLARNLSDRDRQERLSTRDRNRDIKAFAVRGKSRFYNSEADDRPLSTLQAFQAFAKHSQIAATAWLSRLLAVNDADVLSILERVPPERMSPICKEFTLALLNENRRRLLESLES